MEHAKIVSAVHVHSTEYMILNFFIAGETAPFKELFI